MAPAAVLVGGTSHLGEGRLNPSADGVIDGVGDAIAVAVARSVYPSNVFEAAPEPAGAPVTGAGFAEPGIVVRADVISKRLAISRCEMSGVPEGVADGVADGENAAAWSAVT